MGVVKNKGVVFRAYSEVAQEGNRTPHTPFYKPGSTFGATVPTGQFLFAFNFDFNS